MVDATPYTTEEIQALSKKFNAMTIEEKRHAIPEILNAYNKTERTQIELWNIYYNAAMAIHHADNGHLRSHSEHTEALIDGRGNSIAIPPLPKAKRRKGNPTPTPLPS